MPQRQIFCAADRCGKTHRLAEVARHKLLDGVAPRTLLALTVHRPAAAVLRESLSRAAGRHVATTTVRQRALAILRRFPAVAHLPRSWTESALLSGIDRRLLIRRAWAAVGGDAASLFNRRGDQPGALDWVALVFDQFSAWCGTADPESLPTLVPADPHLHELWQAYNEYLRLCREHGVVAFNEVFNRAADALRDESVRRANARNVLLLDDLDLFQPAELLFVNQLIHPESDVYATCTNPPSPASAVELHRWMATWATHQVMRIEACGDEATHAKPRTAGEYATPDAEVHAVARRIIKDAAESDVPRWSDYAIVAFDQALVPLLTRVLPQYGVPIHGEESRDGYTLALAPLALAGLKLLAEQPLSPLETTTLLRQSAIGLGSADTHRLSDAVTQTRFQPFDAVDTRWPDKLSDAGRSRLLDIRALTARIRESGDVPSVKLHAWLTALGLETQVWAQTAAALESWAVQVDRQQWARLLHVFTQTESLRSTLGAPLTLGEAVDVFISAQALVSPVGKPHTDAVHLWQPDALGGCSARLVFVGGLHEGALPQSTPPLPFDDSALAAAYGSLPGFVAPQMHNRAAAWERGQGQLHRAIGRAESAVHLSYSRADRQGRRRLPSPLLAAAIGAHIERHGRLESSMVPLETDAAAEQTQPDTIQVAGLMKPGRIEPLPPLPAQSPPHESPFRVSPSAIEDYFTCPRRCFYARTLGLYDIASSPRQALGQVVHDALNALLLESGLTAVSAERARALVAQHWIRDEYRWGTRLKQAVFKQLAETAVARVARHEAEQDDGRIFIGGELPFEWPLPDSDVVVAGRIDRIDRTPRGLEVIDYKLGQHSPSINALLSEFVLPRAAADSWRPSDIQLPVYALAIEGGTVEGLTRLPGERVASVALIYPLELYNDAGKASIKGKREIKIVDHGDACAACESLPANNSQTGLVCSEQLAFVQQQVRTAVEAMRVGEWQPEPRDGSRTCASCAFRPICTDPQ